MGDEATKTVKKHTRSAVLTYGDNSKLVSWTNILEALYSRGLLKIQLPEGELGKLLMEDILSRGQAVSSGNSKLSFSVARTATIEDFVGKFKNDGGMHEVTILDEEGDAIGTRLVNQNWVSRAVMKAGFKNKGKQPEHLFEIWNDDLGREIETAVYKSIDGNRCKLVQDLFAPTVRK